MAHSIRGGDGESRNRFGDDGGAEPDWSHHRGLHNNAQEMTPATVLAPIRVGPWRLKALATITSPLSSLQIRNPKAEARI